MALLGSYSGELNLHRRQSFERLRSQLDNERASFKSHWRDLNDYILPRRGRFFVSDSNKGDRRNLKIIDSTATLSARTLRSGMMAGITSPSRPWFKLSTPDPKLNEFEPVKAWLHEVTRRMQNSFLKSNLYNVLPTVYGDIGTFGTGCMMMEEDFESVMRFYSFPIGSYMIANDEKYQVRTFFREFRMTVRQIVDRFGRSVEKPGVIDWSNISTKVKSLWDTENTEQWVDVNHVIRPNEKYDPRKAGSQYKRYSSTYYEQGVSGQSRQGYWGAGIEFDKFLSDKGYDYFPVLCPRWEVTGEDVYGTDCPGMSSLGDARQLQTGERRSLQAIEKMINPPMVAPTSMKNSKASILPGDITYMDTRDGMQGFRPAHDIRFDISALENKQDQVRNRIRRAYFEDLFLMLSQSDRRQITAREIDERHEEKLLALGPVLEQLNQDLLDPLIDNGFNIMEKQGAIPPPPEELQGTVLKVEYVSIMAQAQKLVGISGIERFTNYVAGIATIAPAILDKVNGDELVDSYADITSIPPGIVRSDEAVGQIRARQAEQVAQAQKLENMNKAAGTMKQLSETPIDGENALTAVAGGIS